MPALDDDLTLLHRYAETRADDAFAVLVRRHLHFVYAAALRQVHDDTHLAHDVAQTVFTDLARRAAHVRPPVLAGWLHTATHHAAAHAVRSAQRRRAREQLAHAMHDQLHASAHDTAWAQVRPLLDTALQNLPAADRDALLLRFFEAHSFAAIGAALQLTENAARMRVDRALDRLRTQLARRGLTSSAAVLATTLTGYAAGSAAPAGLATTITSGALASLAATAGATSATSFFMGLTKLQTATAAATLALVGGGALLHYSQLPTEPRAAPWHEAGTAAPSPVPAATDPSRVPSSVSILQAQVSTPAAGRPAADRAPSAGTITHPPTRTLPDATAPQATTAVALAGPGLLDAMPSLIGPQTAPEYPFELQALQIPGEVLVSFVVDAAGLPQDVQAVETTDESFAAAAVEAVRQWRFAPGMKGGRAVNTRLRVPVVFRAEGAPPDQ